MSKKNSNENHKNSLNNFKDLNKKNSNFKKKIIFSKRKSFCVAISGGPDSLALAALAKAYSHEKESKFYYVLINHNIRKNSSLEAQKVKTLLKKHKIFLSVLNNKKKINKNIQGQARKIRYDLLLKFCKKKNVKSILTAHNLEDQVETFFIRLSRGSGLTGLSSMNSSINLNSKIKLLRPLLGIQKKFLTKISKNTFGKYFKDPSNRNPKYLRTKIRNLKTHLAKSGISYEQILRSINNLASSKATLEDFYRRLFRDIAKKSNGEILLDKKKFYKLNTEIKMRVINDSVKILKKNYYSIRSKKVNNLIKNLGSKKIKKATLGGCIFFVKKHHICLKKEKK